MRKIALFGGSFNPPGRHHRHLAQALSSEFDEVIVIPCGPRPDKDTVDDLPAPFRAVLSDIAFQGLPRVRVDLFDLEKESFTTSWDLLRQYAPEGEVWLVTGADLIAGGASGESEIQRSWHRGAELWEKARFFVVTRPGYTLKKEDLPPHSKVFESRQTGSSSEIRALLRDGGDASPLLGGDVLRYIQRYGLYRASIPNVTSHVSFADTKWHVFHDTRNPKAKALADTIPHTADLESADAFLVIGGDGTMLRAIREHWRRRIPFFGCNAGHRGFLMNGLSEAESHGIPPRLAVVRQLPLLYVRMEMEDGSIQETYGFNDAWVERATSQSAWLKLDLNGETRLEQIVCDGLLVSTAAGSTAYALSMGAPPLLIDTPAWLVVGSNVMHPDGWKFAMLSQDSRVTIHATHREKRPVNACVDGISYSGVAKMSAFLSRSAAAEIGFFPSHDVAEKITDLQFRGAQWPQPKRAE